MRKALLATVVLLVHVLGAVPGQATTVNSAPAAAGSYEWVGINDEPLTMIGGRDLNLRMAMQVYFNSNGTPQTIRSYLAVTCYYYGAVYPCSFNWKSNLFGGLVDTQEGTVTNTGEDGFASAYGSWRSISGCPRFYSAGYLTHIGLAGYHYPGGWDAYSHAWSPCT